MFVFAHLGGEEQPSPQKAGGDAALAEAAKRNYGTTKEDVEAYGAAAGAAGAVAVCCAAGGVGCAAALLCGTIGGAVGGAIVGAIYNLFTADAPKGIASNQTEDWKIVWNSGETQTGFRMFALGCVEELRGQKFQFTTANLKAQDAVMAPAMPLLQKWKWKSVPAPKAGETWSAWTGRYGKVIAQAFLFYTSQGKSAVESTKAIEPLFNQYIAALTAASGGIIGERAGEKAKNASTPATPSGGIVKVAAVGAAGLGLAWLLGWL
jgi:hypothetical protein